MENQTKNWRKQFIPLILGQSISLIGSSAVQFALMWWLARVLLQSFKSTIK